MALLIETDPVPLATNTQGVVLVGGTRVTLDTVVLAFKDGATAEEIVQQYPSLRLADVYAVIGYYCALRKIGVLHQGTHSPREGSGGAAARPSR